MALIDWQTPLLIALAALGVFLWARHQSSKPRELGEVSLVPYVGIMFVSILVILLCVSYVVTKLKGI